MYPTGIEQPFNPFFQPGHHENLSDLDAGDWVPSSDATSISVLNRSEPAGSSLRAEERSFSS